VGTSKHSVLWAAHCPPVMASCESYNPQQHGRTSPRLCRQNHCCVCHIDAFVLLCLLCSFKNCRASWLPALPYSVMQASCPNLLHLHCYLLPLLMDIIVLIAYADMQGWRSASSLSTSSPAVCYRCSPPSTAWRSSIGPATTTCASCR
jgi:hypothetical protein